jgi:hypothetical protein
VVILVGFYPTRAKAKYAVGFYQTRAKAKYAARCAARDLRRLFADESK